MYIIIKFSSIKGFVNTTHMSMFEPAEPKRPREDDEELECGECHKKRRGDDGVWESRTWPDGSISRHCEDCRFMYECEQCGKESERFGDGDVEDEGWESSENRYGGVDWLCDECVQERENQAIVDNRADEIRTIFNEQGIFPPYTQDNLEKLDVRSIDIYGFTETITIIFEGRHQGDRWTILPLDETGAGILCYNNKSAFDAGFIKFNDVDWFIDSDSNVDELSLNGGSIWLEVEEDYFSALYQALQSRSRFVLPIEGNRIQLNIDDLIYLLRQPTFRWFDKSFSRTAYNNARDATNMMIFFATNLRFQGDPLILTAQAFPDFYDNNTKRYTILHMGQMWRFTKTSIEKWYAAERQKALQRALQPAEGALRLKF